MNKVLFILVVMLITMVFSMPAFASEFDNALLGAIIGASIATGFIGVILLQTFIVVLAIILVLLPFVIIGLVIYFFWKIFKLAFLSIWRWGQKKQKPSNKDNK